LHIVKRGSKNVKFIVYVDDNFHIGEDDERYKLGEYDTCQEAVDACKKIVDEFMIKGYKEGIDFREMWEGYMMFGEDPFIQGGDADCIFSAWDYAKQRCLELCST
jgi:hypothetical protein